jgi:hypothetical protein
VPLFYLRHLLYLKLFVVITYRGNKATRCTIAICFTLQNFPEYSWNICSKGKEITGYEFTKNSTNMASVLLID